MLLLPPGRGLSLTLVRHFLLLFIHFLTTPDCLQQATADQAFTNAKAAGDVNGMTSALIYRALERNTGQVGLASVPCTAITAVNPEIAALQQHQDPASTGAAQINIDITINLAIQISCIGGDPTLALQAGTFAPGQIGDPTAAGNTCDDANDADGCIFTQNLLVEDVSVDEITAAIGSAVCGTGAVNTAVANATDALFANVTDTALAITTDTALAITTAAAAIATDCNIAPSTVTVTVTAGAAMGHVAAAPPAPPAPMGQGQMATMPPPPPAPMNTATPPPPPGMGQDQMAGMPPAPSDMINTATSPAPPAMITALPNPAGNVAIDCSAEIASALSSAGMADLAAKTTAAAAVTATVSPLPAAAATTAASASAGALDFGTCPDPTILFVDGLDGRQQKSFIAADTTSFPHGSALGIKVITDFICQQLDVKCGAAQAALDACAAAATAAGVEGGKDQGAADVFNGALGF